MNRLSMRRLNRERIILTMRTSMRAGGARRFLARAWSDDPSLRREDMFLQSKCGIRKGYYDLSKDYILESVDGILQRLRTDYLDMLSFTGRCVGGAGGGRGGF